MKRVASTSVRKSERRGNRPSSSGGARPLNRDLVDDLIEFIENAMSVPRVTGFRVLAK
jgi:hypothetical protein